MNVGSLFAGIGGFDLGFERCGMRVAWQVERDPFCQAVLARHFPRAERFEDIREVGAAELRPVDLICGGFPCQDLSAAGSGAGIDGPRSGLWSEFARIIRELRPRYVVVENVPALLTGKGKRWDRAPIGRVLGDLAEMGYDAEWARLSAGEFGAPHLRRRVWIVAYPSQDAQARSASESGSERERVGSGSPPSRARELSDADRDRRAEGLRIATGTDEHSRPGNALGLRSNAHLADPEGEPERPGLRTQPAAGQWRGRPRDSGRPRTGQSEIGHARSADWRVEPDLGRVADGVPDRVDRLAALGNALVPQVAEWIGSRILAFEEAQGLR